MFGIECEFTSTVAKRAVASGVKVLALLVPGHPKLENPTRIDPVARSLPLAGTQSNREKTAYPTFRVGDLKAPSVAALIESLRPDGLIVACFSSLIPRSIYDQPGLIALNIHPSLLPAHRGPDPLFWIMRDGGAGFGITVHTLSQRLDSGRIVAQRPMTYPDGAREHELDAMLATAGAELALQALVDFRHGILAGQAQDETLASYESNPHESDYAIDTTCDASQAWNFIRGVADRGVTIRVNTPVRTVRIDDALEFSESEEALEPSDPRDVIIQFRNGWIRALRSRDDQH